MTKTLTVWQRFLADLREEKIAGFQSAYYSILPLLGIYQLVSDGPPEPVATLGAVVYHGWVWMNIVCPLMFLVCRFLFRRAGKASPGERNPALAAAWGMFWGDCGVLGVILIYTACFVATFYFGKPLYVTGFFLMGIPGGAMFTLMSWLRIRDIQAIAKRRREQ